MVSCYIIDGDSIPLHSGLSSIKFDKSYGNRPINLTSDKSQTKELYFNNMRDSIKWSDH